MHKIIIGSTAIKHWFPDFPREPKDLDIIVNVPSMWTKEVGVEYLENDIIYMMYQHLVEDSYLTPDALYTLKISHLVGWDLNWEKHMWDVQWLKSKGCQFIPNLFYDLYDYWNTIHSKNKRSDLDMTAEEFFDNAVNFYMGHDELHYVLTEVPTFTKVLKDGKEVEVCEDKFNALSFEDKCLLVSEEVMVMAYERYQFLGFQQAYSKMLKKFILNHAPLWEASFIVQNFVELHKPKFNYFKHLENGINKNQRVTI